MKNNTPTVWLALCVLLASAMTAGAQGTAFTYQGRLTDNGSPADGEYDLRFTLHDEDEDQVGMITSNNLQVVNGLFTVTLDFGPNASGHYARWLQVWVRPGAANDPVPFVPQLPRQLLTPTPNAIYATTAGTANAVAPLAVTDAGLWPATITGGKIAGNQIVKSLNGLRDDVTLSAGANVTLTPNGNTLQISASGTGSSGWSLSGNAATGSGSFLGTIDDEPLLLKTRGNRALHLESVRRAIINPGSPTPLGYASAINLVGGSAANVIGNGVFGGTVAGGGSFDYTGSFPNQVLDDFGTVGGGSVNQAGGGASSATDARYATVAGGYSNEAGAEGATIGGGENNVIHGKRATVGGGHLNTIGANANYSTIAGGKKNTIENSADTSTISGGTNNTVSGRYATVSGGEGNEVLGNYGVIPGGKDNYVAGFTLYSLASGYRARARHSGSFVWSDSQDTDFASSGANQFCIRASGGMRLDADTSIFFGSQVRQMLNLWSTLYGIGVQADTEYFRTANDFAWYRGGVHNNARTNAGGGTMMMSLDSSGLKVNGKLTTKVLTITGGADVAEPFPMSNEDIPKGALVVIDDQNAGRLKLSDRAYDSRVAGIVSGANGINPGVTLHQEGALEGGQNVALSGRVYALADATHGAIKPGDLLTTSETPGHAMKVTGRDKAQGAIIGKAMTALDRGTGLVLVLVTLQ